jgi:U3 small nucleolar RNA-associated protein 7
MPESQPTAGEPGNSLQPVADQEALERRKRIQQAQQQYGRGRQIALRRVKDKKLRANLKRLEEKYQDAALKAKDAEILLEHQFGALEPEHELERTYKIRQDELRQQVDVETAKKCFDLKLDSLGPYVADFTRDGKGLLLGGRNGHVSTMEWRAGKLRCELQLQETIRDVKWLHNDQYFATAQKKHVYIYDHSGVELHCLKKHIEVTKMEFLPYHYLLATIGNPGHLKYTDTSIGNIVAEIPTKQGTPTAMAQNPYNAIIHLGHQNGTVTLWSPNATTPLVKLLTHHGPVRSLAIDRDGRYMVSAGQDMRMSVWDIRMYKEVNNYFLRAPGSTISISDRGLTAIGWGTQISIWKGLFDKAKGDQQEKIQSPYMSWGGEGHQIERVKWCPFEDVLGIGHDAGYSSLIVPGAGEPNFDAMELNPYESVRQRQEREVKSLLDKLQPGMISLNPEFIGNLDLASHKERLAEKDLDRPPRDQFEDIRSRAKGKNSSLKRFMRKQQKRNIIDERKEQFERLRKEQNMKDFKERTRERKEELGSALARFVRNDA